MRQRWRSLRGGAAFLVAFVLAVIPYCVWCLHDGEIEVPPLLQPLVWDTLHVGQDQGWCFMESINGNQYHVSIWMRYIRIEMVDPDGW